MIQTILISFQQFIHIRRRIICCFLFRFIGGPGFAVFVRYPFGNPVAAAEIIFNEFRRQFFHLIGKAVVP